MQGHAGPAHLRHDPSASIVVFLVALPLCLGIVVGIDSILRTLATLPHGLHLVHATHTVLLDDDVMETIQEERFRAASRDITLELTGFDRRGGPLPAEPVEQAVKDAALRHRDDMRWAGGRT